MAPPFTRSVPPLPVLLVQPTQAKHVVVRQLLEPHKPPSTRLVKPLLAATEAVDVALNTFAPLTRQPNTFLRHVVSMSDCAHTNPARPDYEGRAAELLCCRPSDVLLEGRHLQSLQPDPRGEPPSGELRRLLNLGPRWIIVGL